MYLKRSVDVKSITLTLNGVRRLANTIVLHKNRAFHSYLGNKYQKKTVHYGVTFVMTMKL